MAKSNIIQVGRDTECDITLSSHKVTNRHAIIYAEEGVIYIEDNQSLNGTFVNGKKVIGKQAISLSDTVVVADTNLDMNLVRSKITYDTITQPTEEGKIYCRHCGAKNPLDSIVCYKCGQEVSSIIPLPEPLDFIVKYFKKIMLLFKNGRWIAGIIALFVLYKYCRYLF